MAESKAYGADESIRVSELLAHTKALAWYLAKREETDGRVDGV